jgi:transcriptional regulator with XRE-family HTH domain
MPFNYAFLDEIMIKDKIDRLKLAKLLGISSDYLYRYQRGLRTDAMLSFIEKAAYYTGYPVIAFISGAASEDGRNWLRDVTSVFEIIVRSDRDRLARKASEEELLEVVRSNERQVSVNAVLVRVNRILRGEHALPERAKRLAALARETAAAGIIPFEEIADLLGVKISTLSRWLESVKVAYTCRMDEGKTVMASSPGEAAMRLVCFDCEERAKKICEGFGKGYDPENFSATMDLLEANGIYSRQDQAEILSKSYEMDFTPHALSDLISKKNKGKPIPQDIEDMRVRKRNSWREN